MFLLADNDCLMRSDECCKGMTNNVDPNQYAPLEQSDIGLSNSNKDHFSTSRLLRNSHYNLKIAGSSRKHTFTSLTPLTPLLYSKTGVYKGIHYFSYICSKT